ncbi:MAG: glycogen/starch synthase, partial [Nanoarchaeota archaeon]
MIEAKADTLFEVSWEVCNKVGGIYTVIRSKSSEMLKYYKNYFFIGPYFPQMAIREFYPEAPPDNLKKVIENLKRDGIILLYGRWLINKRPLTLLIDFSKFMDRKNDIKAKLWQDYKIDSLYTEKDFDEPVVWATSVGMVLEELANVFKGKLVAHFHEWLSSAGILYIKKKNLNIKTVFTTHATVLGRSFASANIDFYCFQGNKCHLERIDIEKEAYNLGVSAKHQLERISVERCDVFTTVSEITGMEAKYILKRSPDVLVPNGLDTFGLPNQEEIPIKHRIFKEKIKDFIIPYFFPFYSFDLDNTLFYFLSGRYEFRNKGIDITIKALSLLNERLRKKQSDKTIVVFFFVPNAIKIIHPEFLES